MIFFHDYFIILYIFFQEYKIIVFLSFFSADIFLTY